MKQVSPTELLVIAVFLYLFIIFAVVCALKIYTANRRTELRCKKIKSAFLASVKLTSETLYPIDEPAKAAE